MGMIISDMFSDSSKQVRNNTRARLFAEHRIPSVFNTVVFALLGLFLWGADWALNLGSMKKALAFRLAIAGIILLSALVKWLVRAVSINFLATYIALAIGEVLTIALITHLPVAGEGEEIAAAKAGLTAGSGQMLYFFLGAVLLSPLYSTKWVIPGCLSLALIPHLAGEILAPEFPHLLFGSVIWPACAIALLIHWRLRPILVENIRLRHETESAVLFDPVTGLLNKRGLEHSFQRLSKMSGIKPLNQFLLLIAIDGLDGIKKAHGEETAQSIRAQLGQSIDVSFRSRDITASLGNEFACVLLHLSRENAFDIAERFRGSIAGKDFECPSMPGGKMSCTVSIGIIAIDIKENIDSLTNLARVGVSQAKSLGGNQCACI